MQKLASGEFLLEQSLNSTSISKKFSADVGSEAKEVKLSLALRVTALSYQTSDLTSLALKNASSAPNGYILDKNRSGIKINEVKTDKTGAMTAKATVTSYYIPDLDLIKIKTNLTGKSYQQASSYLTTVTGIGGVIINEINSIPFMKNRLPMLGKNLQLTIVSL